VFIGVQPNVEEEGLELHDVPRGNALSDYRFDGSRMDEFSLREASRPSLNAPPPGRHEQLTS
jgi:hypothetical protein